MPKEDKAPGQVERVLGARADLVLAWAGNGTVRRSLSVLAGNKIPLAVLPARTANLFATNLSIPSELEQAVQIGLHGQTRKSTSGAQECDRRHRARPGGGSTSARPRPTIFAQEWKRAGRPAPS